MYKVQFFLEKQNDTHLWWPDKLVIIPVLFNPQVSRHYLITQILHKIKIRNIYICATKCKIKDSQL